VYGTNAGRTTNAPKVIAAIVTAGNANAVGGVRGLYAFMLDSVRLQGAFAEGCSVPGANGR
jgi:N-acetylglutamate synthase/N-acetylornithine aminotransferase